ncbi:hypothetical protein P22_0685 [Propionispora sp. 2/2-37]|uniref:ATP-binding protein n=1 Tax=Propionispora sp. 2/2-37 TaxID=1677858 RepID=UPI0006BB7AD3|nr:ATP-binding protein [Propionispora sp. 2/2-37]CUH94619.1 hypothetical protein P22_0685 [Propionispora sp. 2/2-37]
MTDTVSQLNRLIIYRNVIKDSLVQSMLSIISGSASLSQTSDWYGRLLEKAEHLSLRGNLLHQYLLYLIARDENVFSRTLQHSGGKLGKGLQQALVQDITLLQEFFVTDFRQYVDMELLGNYEPTVCRDQHALTVLQNAFLGVSRRPEELIDMLVQYYLRYGYGDIAGYTAFRWQGAIGLTGIEHYDTIRLTDIIGYERQKTTLVKNTEAFLSDRPSNNVLLVGARGTGKSSSVKALANEYFSRGLRLVEVAKSELQSLPRLMEVLRQYRQHFIIFLDDLSFEEFEVEYKYLKSVIEGGVETKPPNVLIYATSNRRHLIKETWADRSENLDELHRADAVNEKISLSDRFGIVLSFIAPSQQEYLAIVSELAHKYAIALSPEELKTAALQWEISHTGRSGRTAQQFINHLVGQQIE